MRVYALDRAARRVGTAFAKRRDMANATPAGFRDVSYPGVERYATEDGNVLIQRINARTWVVLPRGRDNSYANSKGAAVNAALRIAREIAANETHANADGGRGHRSESLRVEGGLGEATDAADNTGDL